MSTCEHEDILDYVSASNFLGVPERVLREWVQWNFRRIPFHKLGSGKRADVGFFKDELDMWFRKNGGAFLKDKVQDRPERVRNDSGRRSSYGQPYRRAQ